MDVLSGCAFRRQCLGSDPEHVTSHNVKFEKFRRPLRRQPLVLQRVLARPAVGLLAISSSCKPDGCGGNETDRLEDVCPTIVITIEAESRNIVFNRFSMHGEAGVRKTYDSLLMVQQ